MTVQIVPLSGVERTIPKSDYFLIDVRGYFFYALYSNSNFLGNSREWALFTKSYGAALYHTYQEAEAAKNRYCEEVQDTITKNLNRYATMPNIPEGWAAEYERCTKRLLKRFQTLTVYERVRKLPAERTQ